MDKPRLCPSCKAGNLQLRNGRHGRFYGCENYPECEYTLDANRLEQRPPTKEERSTSTAMLQLAMTFIADCGSVDSAYQWLGVAKNSLLATSGRMKCSQLTASNAAKSSPSTRQRKSPDMKSGNA